VGSIEVKSAKVKIDDSKTVTLHLKAIWDPEFYQKLNQ
jgi:hypothetical protein